MSSRQACSAASGIASDCSSLICSIEGRTMSDKTPEMPKIEFPCQYPVKVICNAGARVIEQVLRVGRQHGSERDADKFVVQNSKNGRFQSLRLIMNATSEQQLQLLFADLKATGQVHMVL